MRKDEFLRRLEELLIDVSEEERKEAMAFYQGYFDDAGVENEARIIAELVSPENVAETIKRDLGMVTVAGEMNDFDDNGDWTNSKNTSGNNEAYEHQRQAEGTYYRWSETQEKNSYGNYYENQNVHNNEEKKNTWLKPLLIVIAVLTFPTWFGLLAGFGGTIIGLVAALVSITVAMFVVGVVFVGLGIVMLTGLAAAVVSIPAGLAFVGAGLLVLAFALLLLLACVGLFGKFFPWVVQSISRLCKRIFAKKEDATV